MQSVNIFNEQSAWYDKQSNKKIYIYIRPATFLSFISIHLINILLCKECKLFGLNGLKLMSFAYTRENIMEEFKGHNNNLEMVPFVAGIKCLVYSIKM